MRKKVEEIVVDLTNLNLTGDILDMGFEGKGIIYRTMKEKKIGLSMDEAAVTMDSSAQVDDYDWVYGYPEELPFEDNIFDGVTVFFSFSYIKRKYIRSRAIREIVRILKENGKVYIWDLNISFLGIVGRKNVRVILPSKKSVNFTVNQTGRTRTYGMNSLIPVLERYFDIEYSKDMGTYFYIEAVKMKNIEKR